MTVDDDGIPEEDDPKSLLAAHGSTSALLCTETVPPAAPAAVLSGALPTTVIADQAGDTPFEVPVRGVTGGKIKPRGGFVPHPVSPKTSPIVLSLPAAPAPAMATSAPPTEFSPMAAGGSSQSCVWIGKSFAARCLQQTECRDENFWTQLIAL